MYYCAATSYIQTFSCSCSYVPMLAIFETILKIRPLKACNDPNLRSFGWVSYDKVGVLYSGKLGHFLYSRIPPVENGPFRLDFFFDWILLVLLLIASRVDFIVFVLFLEAVGVRAYCCTAVEIGWHLCASRFLREQWLDEPSPQRFVGFGLSRKPPKLRSWSCTQPRAAKATAGAAVVGSMGSIPRAAAVV